MISTRSMLIMGMLTLSVYVHPSLVDTFSEKNFERHMGKNYGLAVLVTTDRVPEEQAVADILALRNIEIVAIHEKYYLDCTVSKASWDEQRKALDLHLKLAKLWYYFEGVGAFASGCVAWMRFDEMFRIYANIDLIPQEYVTMCKTLAVAKLVLSLVIARYVLNEFGKQAAFARYLCEVIGDESRILGFRMMSGDDTEVRLRTDFSVNEFID
jgi:hypothetical protein